MSEYIYERPEQPAKVVRDGWNVRIEWDFVQREEIVRCRDCVYATDGCYGCRYFSHVDLAWDYRWKEVHAKVEPDGFCSWGERKGDG